MKIFHFSKLRKKNFREIKYCHSFWYVDHSVENTVWKNEKFSAAMQFFPRDISIKSWTIDRDTRAYILDPCIQEFSLYHINKKRAISEPPFSQTIVVHVSTMIVC